MHRNRRHDHATDSTVEPGEFLLVAQCAGVILSEQPTGVTAMKLRVPLGCVIAIVAFASAQGATQPPISVAKVTTVVERHKGGVGGVVVDQLGYVYIGDFQENIWKLNPVDNELTLHASGLYGASGNTFDKNGNLYQGNFYGQSVSRISRAGQVTTVLAENLDGPVGMIFDTEGSLLICNCLAWILLLTEEFRDEITYYRSTCLVTGSFNPIAGETI